ncbi:2,5-diamino-6-(ribosylamino)-4(3H)-pyrimidinone 5'-phosphate reductase [Nowakowskiella sp. JEL0407]|nr:2,5-diamino-6-(ribosylamino)-4(3H)-pyrimidinone 5'-phosphate reductase [Nowakowskiella sp. JEL0407]
MPPSSHHLPDTCMNLTVLTPKKRMNSTNLNSKALNFFNPDLQSTAPHSHRPIITITYAQSLDGFISLRSSQTILSSAESNNLTHALRATHDFILVGGKTVANDDPLLNTRNFKFPDSDDLPPSPRPVILDTGLKIPVNSKILTRQPIIFCGVDAVSDPQTLELRSIPDITVISVAVNDSTKQLDIMEILRILRDRFDCKRLMVEGGARIIRSFLKSRLADFLIVTVSPRFLYGGVHITWDGEGDGEEFEPGEVKKVKYEHFGVDIVMLKQFT